MRYPLSLLPALCLGLICPLVLPISLSLWFTFSCALVLGLLCKKQPLILPIVVLLLAISYTIFRADLALDNRLPVEMNRQTQAVEIMVRGLAQETQYGTRFTAKILSGSPTVVGKKIIVNDYKKQHWPSGSLWSVNVNLRVPVGVVNQVGFNTEAWHLSEGIGAIGHVRGGRTFLGQSDDVFALLGRLREKMSQRIDQVGKDYPRGASLLAALTIGRQGSVAPEDWQAFRATGITHLVSISGLHVTMVALFAAWLGRNMMRIIPPRSLYPKTVMLLVGVLAALAYALLAGFSVPTQRSVFMLATAAIMVGSRQYFTPWQVWWGALTVVLLIDPFAILGVGFWLSFGLVASLVWLGSNRRKVAKKKWLLAIKAQGGASLASVVPLGLFFGQLPLLSPLVNALAIPWVSWILTPLSLLALVLPFDQLLRFSCRLCELSLNALDQILPFALIYSVAHVPWLLLTLALVATVLILAPRGVPLKAISVLILVLFICYQPAKVPSGTVKITVLDVGQGSSLLAQTQNHTLLFDTGAGSGERIVLPILRAQGVRQLSALVVSHNDIDHDQGLPEIMQALPVQRVLAGEHEAYPLFDVQHCTEGEVWNWDGVRFEWLTPERFAKEGNDQSCVLRIVAGAEAFLVTGDLSLKGEQILLDSYQASLASQILVLGHHGSKTSSSSRFLATVAPTDVIISAGFANRYRHPHPLVLARANAQARVWRTDRQGAIVIWMGKGIRIEQEVRRKPFWQLKPFDGEQLGLDY